MAAAAEAAESAAARRELSNLRWRNGGRHRESFVFRDLVLVLSRLRKQSSLREVLQVQLVELSTAVPSVVYEVGKKNPNSGSSRRKTCTFCCPKSVSIDKSRRRDLYTETLLGVWRALYIKKVGKLGLKYEK